MARQRELTHLDARGQARMVDVGDKAVTQRSATARATVRMKPATLKALRDGTTPKGDVLAVARIAGIQAAKRTPELIPMCHHVQLTSVKLELTLRGKNQVEIEARASASDRTGVEMEALTAVSVAALTLYDMLKAIDRGMVIERVALHEKRGGKSGDYQRK
jgi:cyclic pyranopterin phosphate synthase